MKNYMKNINKIIGLVFCIGFVFLGSAYTVSADETITCVRDCFPVRTTYVGTVTLNLECNRISPLNYRAQLKVNGVTTPIHSKDCRSDLTAGPVLENTATVGISKIFSAVISNSGPGVAKADFSNFFQIKYPDGSIDDLPPQTMATITTEFTRTEKINFTFAARGRHYMRACTDLTSSAGGGVITERNERNQCGTWTTVEVSGVPDLTVDPSYPNDATVGTARTFSALINNIGTQGTGNSFSNFLQVKKGTNIDDQTATIMLPLLADKSKTETATYIFADAGRYSVRFCADKTSSAGGGVIDESNELNQCGVWAEVNATTSPTYTCTGPTPANASVFSTDYNSLTANTGKTYSPTDTGAKCQFSCDENYAWNGSSCEVASKPDLTVDPATPNEATVNVRETFSAKINNIGTANATTSFYNFFQVMRIGRGTIDLGRTLMSGDIEPGGNRTETVNYTFPSIGTYSIRACADSDNNISELIETNQCGIWTTVDVRDTRIFTCTGPVPPNTVFYSGDLDDIIGDDVASTYAENNTSAKCEYSCAAGFTYDTISNLCKGTVVSPDIVSFTSSAKIVRMNQTFSLDWKIDNFDRDTTECVIKGPRVPSYVIESSESKLDVADLTSKSNYTLRCSSPGGVYPDVIKTLEVQVIPSVGEV